VDESAIQTYSYQNLDHATSGDEPASPSPLSPMTEMNTLQSAKGTCDDLHIHSHAPSHASHPVPATFIVKALAPSRTRIKGATAATPTDDIHPVHTTRTPIRNVYPREILSTHLKSARWEDTLANAVEISTYHLVAGTGRARRASVLRSVSKL
jgi:hypothetical protein